MSRAVLVVVLVIGGCGGVPAGDVGNRGGAARRTATCGWPARAELAARRYPNVDHDDPTYDQFTEWRIVVATRSRADGLSGTVEMEGDRLKWSFPARGSLDCERGLVSLGLDTHEPMSLQYELAAQAGSISSIDDHWLIGPRFPDHRP